MATSFYGVNIAVKDLDAATTKFENVLGVKAVPTPPEAFAFPGLKGASLTVGGVVINLIASDNPETSVYKFVENKGEGLFLMSLKVDNLENSMADLTAKGVKFVGDKPMPFKGTGNQPGGFVGFGHPKTLHGVQIEFMQQGQ